MSDYKVEDLLSIIGNGSKSEPEPLSETELETFIRKHDIEAGTDRIPNYIIWYTYKAKFQGSLSKVEFFRQFKKKFEQKRTGQQRVYMLNCNSFDLTHEGKVEAEFFNKE